METDVIKRRHKNGIKNLFDIYIPIVDEALIYDNSDGNHLLIAEKLLYTEIEIIEKEIFENLNLNYEHK